MAGLELYRDVGRVLNLRTGEMLVLADAALDDLAEAREALGQLWHERTTAAAMIDAELVRRADEALRTGEDDFGHGARFRVRVDRGGAVQYDSNALRADLLQRANRREIPVTLGAVEGLFIVTQYRLDLVRWRNMCKRWPELVEIGERHSNIKRRGTKIERLAVDGTAVDESEAA